ncbi:uncharacterized protein MELLADRAFT_105586 [Melampsora larici-populina 98AG31]|uniref:Uncharacterized protein n=1 Tax=Melampsora larici-populina (strain 98AG31 / pathotype 3-4-7) TaxID=747676 RepID=F4RIQ2_MELLP|nr:uncharacterized protein MELLADRAFT_105586 [Melampsora larici-populina 98AG31]EGG07601.1 hypothetical protein MELLADRAFT_105586 [Melampsora larici-populina 98AG31]
MVINRIRNSRGVTSLMQCTRSQTQNRRATSPIIHQRRHNARRGQRGHHPVQPRVIKRNRRMTPCAEESPLFWRKAFTLPDSLIRFIFPDCNLWDYFTTRKVLRALINHFDPGYYLPRRVSKTDLIQKYEDLVKTEYGILYG